MILYSPCCHGSLCEETDKRYKYKHKNGYESLMAIYECARCGKHWAIERMV